MHCSFCITSFKLKSFWTLSSLVNVCWVFDESSDLSYLENLNFIPYVHNFKNFDYFSVVPSRCAESVVHPREILYSLSSKN